MTMPPEEWVTLVSEPECLRSMSHGELKALRCRMRQERQSIHSEAISHGPSEDLCRRLNELEMLERLVARAAERRERTGGMRQMLTAIRRAAPLL